MTQTKSFVDTSHYHLWTDALHARSLAHNSKNNWDRGTYIRWSVITACSVFEMACRDALEDGEIGRSLKRDIDKAIYNKHLPAIDWSQGVWQQILKLFHTRKTYVHVNIPQADLFPSLTVADESISLVRKAVKLLYKICSKNEPAWINDDEDRGWDNGANSVAHCTLIRAGAQSDPNAIKIAYVYKGIEHISDICLAQANYETLMEDLIKRVNIPISAVRAYRGNELISEILVMMRGA